MTLQSGTRLGPYEIQSAAGAGGMGEVYRARDTRLGRTVAIKVLAAHLVSRPDVLDRFEREARAISRLNHPNICALHDVGMDGGTHYLVMEYVEGETLAARLARGALPLADVFRVGIPIGEALDQAHRNGIVHRDLKPGNVMLCGGKGPNVVKLLDFGLAKLPEAQALAAADSSSQTSLPTQTQPLTSEGMIVGTLQYMAPEQLEGRAADALSDIFAFGAVLFEMVTGRKAFQGSGQASLISAVMKDQPPAVSTLQPLAPPALDRVIRRCLAKDPDDRWQSVRDLVDELRWISEGSAPASAAAAPNRGRSAVVWFAIGVAVAGIAALGVARFREKTPAGADVARLVVKIPEGSIRFYNGCPLAVSPDGTKVVYETRTSDVSRLYLRRLDQFQPSPIAGTDGGVCPFFSPDGNWIAFFGGGKLKKAPLTGEQPVSICDAPPETTELWGGSWGPDGTIIFAPGPPHGLYRVAASGGAPVALTTPDTKRHEIGHVWPDILPGGEAVLFSMFDANRGWGDHPISVLSLKNGQRRILSKDFSWARYLGTGDLICYRNHLLFAVPFDLRRLEITGPAVSLLEGVGAARTTGPMPPLAGISAAGSLAFVPDDPRTRTSQLMWVTPAGGAQPLGMPEKEVQFPVLSPDGRSLAMTLTEQARAQIWIWDVERGALSRLTYDGNNHAPIWSPDGQWVIYSSTQDGAEMNLFRKRAGGTGAAERLTSSVNHQDPGSFAPDGRSLVYGEFSGRGIYEIWVLDVEKRAARPFLQTPFNETEPILSPDGRWIAYSSNESGRGEVYVQPFPEGGRKWQVSTGGGNQPLWSRDGRTLYYRAQDRLMSVGVESRPEFRLGKQQELFSGNYQGRFGFGHASYDITPRGDRFLMAKPSLASGAGATEIDVILNWQDEWKRRMGSPAKRGNQKVIKPKLFARLYGTAKAVP